MKQKIFILALLATITLSACNNSDEDSTTSTDSSTNALVAFDQIESSDDYLFDTNTTNIISFSGETITTAGSGATVSSNIVTIEDAGNYILTGNGSNTQVIVKAGSKDVVKLGIKNLSLSYSKSSPIFVDKAYKTVIYALDGDNNISDKSSYTDVAEGQNACIYSQSHLVLAGSGKLSVTANYLDGITSKDGLVINGPTISVTAKDDGIRGKDYLVVKGGSFNVTAGGNGFNSDEESDQNFGYITFEAGNATIVSGGDGISAFTNITLRNSTLDITSGGGSSKTKSTTLSTKGVKASNLLTIENTNIQASCADDALHSDNTVNLDGGKYRLSCSDDGIHGGGIVTIKNADITISKSVEGIEGKTLTFDNNTISILSTDDSVNATNGQRTESSDGSNITINSGTYVLSGENGDPLDSNGSIAVNGGKIIIHGPAKAPEVPIDYNGTFKVTGGSLIASGLNSNMTQAPSTSSTINSAKIIYKSSQSANTLVVVTDESGNVVAGFKPSRAYTAIILSSDKLVTGKTYNIYSAGIIIGDVASGYYANITNYSNGTLKGSFTISSIVSVTTVN